MSKTVHTDAVSQKLSWNNIGTVDKLQRADSIKVSPLLNCCGNVKCGKRVSRIALVSESRRKRQDTSQSIRWNIG